MDKKKIQAYKTELEHMLKKEKKKKQVKVVEFFNEEHEIPNREDMLHENDTSHSCKCGDLCECGDDCKCNESIEETHNSAVAETHNSAVAETPKLEDEQKASISVVEVASIVVDVAKVVSDVASIVVEVCKEESPHTNIPLNFKCSPHDKRDFIVSVKDEVLTLFNQVKKVVQHVIPSNVPLAAASRIRGGRRAIKPVEIVETVVVVNPPVKKVDLSRWCSSVKDQGSVGSCTSFSFIGLMEYNYNKYCADGKEGDDIFSEKFLYYITRVKVENVSPQADNGAYLRDVLKAAKLYGVCKEKSCPYYSPNGSIEYSAPPTDNMYDEAQNFQILQYARVDDNPSTMLKICKVLLDNERPFVGGFICFENLHNGRNGVIPLPSGRMVGGHAILFVGYDDEKRLLKFKNSWGEAWGDKGYGYLPYEFMERNLVQDVWTVYRQEHNNESIGIVKTTDI